MCQTERVKGSEVLRMYNRGVKVLFDHKGQTPLQNILDRKPVGMFEYLEANVGIRSARLTGRMDWISGPRLLVADWPRAGGWTAIQTAVVPQLRI